MEQDRFDSIAKAVAARSNRRRMLKGLLGLGSGAAVASVALSPVGAARRGYSRPVLPAQASICREAGPCMISADCCSRCCISVGGADPVCADSEVCLP